MANRQKIAVHLASIKSKEVKSILDNKEISQLISIFLFKFIILESLYKSVFVQYKQRNGKKLTESKKRNLKIERKQVGLTLDWLNIDYDQEKLDRIFGSGDKDKESIQTARNKLVHKFSFDEVLKLCEDFDEIISYLDYFINLFDERNIEK